MPSDFKALEVSEEEGNFLLNIVEKSVNDLPEGDLLVKVNYSSLNYKDAMSVTGMPGVTRKYPHTPGIDAAGKIAESKVPDFKEGDEVIVTGYDLGMNTPGGFGEYIRVPSNWAVHLPKGLTTKQSMSLGTAGLTAGLSIHALDSFREYTGLKNTKSVVSGATGGVGSISVMLLSKLGSEVTAVTGKKDKKDLQLFITKHKLNSDEEWNSNIPLDTFKLSNSSLIFILTNSSHNEAVIFLIPSDSEPRTKTVFFGKSISLISFLAFPSKPYTQ